MGTDFSGYIKFGIGDQVWFAADYTEYLHCSVCNGTGQVKLNSPAKIVSGNVDFDVTNMKCPVCGGADWGSTWCRDNKYFANVPYDAYMCEYGRVCGIYADIDEHEGTDEVCYNFEVSGGKVMAYVSATAIETFDNKEDCQKYCDEKTAENLCEAKRYIYPIGDSNDVGI